MCANISNRILCVPFIQYLWSKTMSHYDIHFPLSLYFLFTFFTDNNNCSTLCMLRVNLYFACVKKKENQASITTHQTAINKNYSTNNLLDNVDQMFAFIVHITICMHTLLAK